MAATAFALLDALSAALEPLAPYAEAITVFKFPALDAYLEGLNAPVATDVLKYLLAMFAAYPLSAVFAAIPSSLKPVKHLFSLIAGVVLAQVVFGYQWVHPLVCAVFVYAVVAGTAGIRALDGSRHLIVFVFMLTYMTLAHLLRLYHDYMGWSLDITGPLMLLTIKLSAFGYNYYDGVTNNKPPAADAEGWVKRLYADRQSKALESIPSPLEYFAWVFNYATFFAGPAFELREYLNTVNRTAAEQAALPSRAVPVLVKFGQGVLFLALNGALGGGSSPFAFLKGVAPNVAINPALLSQPNLLATGGYALVCLFFVRCKYYAAWKVSEGAAVLAGYGYQAPSPKEKTGNWNAVSNVDVLSFEFADNISNGSKAWNQRTQAWLENYVYKRSPRSLNMIFTYFISAFWHGFYPGYYLFFLSVPLAQNLSKAVQTKLRPLTIDEAGKPKSWKFLYDGVGILFTHVTMNYLASAFVALGWENATTIWGAYKYSVHIIMIVFYALISFLPAPKAKAKTA